MERNNTQFGNSNRVWEIQNVDSTASTNDLAKELPPWNAVVAGSQFSGRGRHGRKFVSAPGGLWMSAVVPIPGDPSRWTGLAIAVGWGILHWLRSLPVAGARLRWPNDLMQGNCKLGGILLEQGGADRCVVGLGMNVHNHPEKDDPALAGQTVSLADLIPACPPSSDLVEPVLHSISAAWEQMEKHGLAGMADDLNTCWGGPREVEIRPLDGDPVFGRFLGIDPAGALVLGLSDGGGRIFPAHTVERMVELF